MSFKIAITISLSINQLQYGSGIYFQAGNAETAKVHDRVEILAIPNGAARSKTAGVLPERVDIEV